MEFSSHFSPFLPLFGNLDAKKATKSGPKNKKSPSMNKRSNEVLNPTKGPHYQIV